MGQYPNNIIILGVFMQKVNEGYVMDLPYGAYYCSDISPSLLRMLCVLSGADFPKRENNEPLRYLELGYGHGISLNVHAATNSGEFWGTDFNSTHFIEATEASKSAQLNTTLLNSSFEKLYKHCEEGRLPQFDVIVLHGIWSWINDENRQYILNIISKNLKVGGIVYVSYNVLPGCASFVPIRDLFVMHADNLSTHVDDSALRMQKAYSFALSLEKIGARYFSSNPFATKKLKSLENMSMPYIVHEYMNKDWAPFYFKDVANLMASVQCSFLTNTELRDQEDIFIPPKIVQFLAQAPTVLMRETLRDYILNRPFRKDVFIKGEANLSVAEQSKLLEDMPICLGHKAINVPSSVEFRYCVISLEEKFHKSVITALADKNYQPKTLNALKKHPACKGMSEKDIKEAIFTLLAVGFIHPAQKVNEVQKSASVNLNKWFCKKSRKDTYSNVLASPILGKGIYISRVEQLFLDAQFNNLISPAEWAKYAYDILKATNKKLSQDDLPYDENEVMEVLLSDAKSFEKESMPFLLAMGAIESIKK